MASLRQKLLDDSNDRFDRPMSGDAYQLMLAEQGGVEEACDAWETVIRSIMETALDDAIPAETRCSGIWAQAQAALGD